MKEDKGKPKDAKMPTKPAFGKGAMPKLPKAARPKGSR